MENSFLERDTKDNRGRDSNCVTKVFKKIWEEKVTMVFTSVSLFQSHNVYCETQEGLVSVKDKD